MTNEQFRTITILGRRNISIRSLTLPTEQETRVVYEWLLRNDITCTLLSDAAYFKLRNKE